MPGGCIYLGNGCVVLRRTVKGGSVGEVRVYAVIGLGHTYTMLREYDLLQGEIVASFRCVKRDKNNPQKRRGDDERLWYIEAWMC